MKTLRQLLDEGVRLTPVFSDPTCKSFRVGFFYNGTPHAIAFLKKRYKSHEEAQKFINEFLEKWYFLDGGE